MTGLHIVRPEPPLRLLVKRTLALIPNANTKRAYSYILRQFVQSGKPLNRQGVTDFLADMMANPVSASYRSQLLAGIRKLIAEAVAEQALTMEEAWAIGLTRPVGKAKKQVRLGRWLSLEGTQQLRALPNKNSLVGARDLALIGLLLGCGLRRSEAITVTWEQFREVGGRMALADIVGKGDRLRSVPVADWVAEALYHWQGHLRADLTDWAPEAAESGLIIRNVVKPTEGICATMAHRIIEGYATAMDIRFAPHDLRRTLAQLMRKAGAPIEQIQMTLGHEGIATTERYLGGAIELAPGKAAVDLIQWSS